MHNSVSTRLEPRVLVHLASINSVEHTRVQGAKREDVLWSIAVLGAQCFIRRIESGGEYVNRELEKVCVKKAVRK